MILFLIILLVFLGFSFIFSLLEAIKYATQKNFIKYNTLRNICLISFVLLLIVSFIIARIIAN